MKLRNSNFELLRLISMLLIVAHHYSIHGNWNMDDSINLNRLFIQFLSIGGKLGVNLFVMITGYFMIKSNIKLNSLIKLVTQTWFYSVLFFFINQYFQIVPVDGLIILKSFLPIIFNSYWFITSFVVLFLLIPYLNILINNLNQRQHLILLMSLIVLNVLIPINLGFGSVDWFIFLYVLGSYISLYPKLFSNARQWYLTIFILTYLGVFGTIVILDYLKVISPLYFISENSPFILICSISLFSYFKNLIIGNNRIINTMASSVFGVYLIHDNIFARTILWERIFKNSEYLNSNYLMLHAVVAILLTFTTSLALDLIRNKLVTVLNIQKFNQAIINLVQGIFYKLSTNYNSKYLD